MTTAPARTPDAREHAGGRRRGRAPALLVGLGILLCVCLALNVGIGAVEIGPLEVLAILADRVGIDLGVSYSEQQSSVLWAIRLPRVVLGALVGAGLAICGAALQGIFRNPLADPSLIGVSSGASLGAAAVIVLGITTLGLATLPVAAFLGALLATLAVYALARHDGRTEVVTLLLTGLAVAAIAGAGVGLATFVADDEELRDIVFWTLGSVGGATWDQVIAAAPFVITGLVLLPFMARDLDLMTLGEREATHLGVDTERTRVSVIVLTALATGAGVAVAGIVGFIGLVVPHLVRLVAGPGHRLLLPASALAGASLLLLADLASRTVVSPAELPLGVVTALVGGPFFLWLLHRTRREHGGWG